MYSESTVNLKHSVLCIDDSVSQLEIYKSELKDFYNVYTAGNYAEAIDILGITIPEIIILDVNMPEIDGYQFMEKANAKSILLPDISIIMVSSDDSISSLQRAFESGVSDYIRKPYNSLELKLRIENQLSIQRKRSEYQFSKLKIEAMMNKSNMNETKDSIVFTLTELAKTRDDETGSHLERIKKYVLILSQALSETNEYEKDLTDDFINTIYNMSALHDIGKVGISDNILKKPGQLTPDEFKIMKTHTNIGGIILKRSYSNFNNFEFLKTGMNIAMYHHERWDGKGYPLGISGKSIPLEARIVSVADVFDALTTKRVYKEEFSNDKTLTIMKSESGKGFDPIVYEAFLKVKDKLFEVKDIYSD